MCWRQWIQDAYSLSRPDGYSLEPVFYPPTSHEVMAEAETTLNVTFPEELAALLSETNGVMNQMRFSTSPGADEMVDTGYLFWSVSKIREENLTLREWANGANNSYLPLDGFLFFADAGNGDLFGYAITNRRIPSGDIYMWNHEDDSRTPVAPSLRTFLDSWLSGKIKI